MQLTPQHVLLAVEQYSNEVTLIYSKLRSYKRPDD